MTNRTDFTDIPPPVEREAAVWRTLVGVQVTVLLLIVAAIAIIAVSGAMSALFAQRVP